MAGAADGATGFLSVISLLLILLLSVVVTPLLPVVRGGGASLAQPTSTASGARALPPSCLPPYAYLVFLLLLLLLRSGLDSGGGYSSQVRTHLVALAPSGGGQFLRTSKLFKVPVRAISILALRLVGLIRLRYGSPYAEQIGTCGYVWQNQFNLALPNVRPTHSHIWINNVRWLRHVLRYFGVRQVQRETYQVPGPREWWARVDFAIPGLGHGGRPQEMSVYGLEVPEEVLAEKYGVEAAVKALGRCGFEIPTYTSMMVEAMDKEDQYENLELCLAKARTNPSVADQNMTYAACSFEAIFNQVIRWRPPVASRQKLMATKKESTTGPSLIVVSRPCLRRAEATESVLCTALAYISDVCGCRIGDLHYGQQLIRRFQREHPGVLPP